MYKYSITAVFMLLHVQLKQQRSPGQTPLKQQEDHAGVAKVCAFHHRCLKQLTPLKDFNLTQESSFGQQILLNRLSHKN